MAKRNRHLVGLIMAAVVIIATLVSSGAAPGVLASGVEIPWERVTPTPEGERWVLVGPAENPIRLDRRDPNFLKHYLTYCSAEEYKEITGHEYEPPRGVPRKLLFPEFSKEDIQRAEAFLERLRAEGQARLGTEEPPDEVHREEDFPPAGRQLWQDCGAWSLSYAGTSCQKAQFEAWAADGWEPKWILSPLWLSSFSNWDDCSISYPGGLYYYREKGALTQDRLPYGDGDCHWYEPSEEDLELAYPLRVESYETIFARTTSGGDPYVVGEIEDLMWAIALGKNVTLSFGPQDRSKGYHGVAVGGYTPDGVHCLNSWGSDWGPEGNGWFWFTWQQLLGEEPVSGPFFSPPKLIYVGSKAAVDWDGECTLPEAEYRDVCRADLAVIKSDSSNPVGVGSNLTYLVTAENNGPNYAAGVVITDTLPKGVTFVSANPSQGTGCKQSGGAVSCDLGDLDVAASAEASIVTSANEPGIITNTVTVSSSTTDPDESNNTAVEETTAIAQADLAIAKSDSVDPVVAGQELVWTLTVENNGPSDAFNVVVTDTLPSEVTLASVNASQGSWESGNPDGTVSCSLGAIPSGGRATITITVSVDPSFTGTSLENTATVSSSTTDPDESNNSATETTAVTAEADLSVEKTASPNPVIVGGTLTYTIVVSNAGPSDATNVVVTDTLPSEVTLMDVSTSQGSWESGNPDGTVSCSLGTIPAGSQATITIKVSVDSGSSGMSFANTAATAGSSYDPDEGNNWVLATTKPWWQNYLPLILARLLQPLLKLPQLVLQNA